jgi:hypothetical protein
MRSRRKSIPIPRYNDFLTNHQLHNIALNVDNGGALPVGAAPTRGLVIADLMAQDGTGPTEMVVEPTLAVGNVDSSNYTAPTAFGSNGAHCANDIGNDKDGPATGCDTNVDILSTTNVGYTSEVSSDEVHAGVPCMPSMEYNEKLSPQANEDRPMKRKKEMQTIGPARGNPKDDDDEKYSSDAPSDANSLELPRCNLNEHIAITEYIKSEDVRDESTDMNDGMASKTSDSVGNQNNLRDDDHEDEADDDDDSFGGTWNDKKTMFPKVKHNLDCPIDDVDRQDANHHIVSMFNCAMINFVARHLNFDRAGVGEERFNQVQYMLNFTTNTVLPLMLNELRSLDLNLSGNEDETLWDYDRDTLVQVGAMAMLTGSFLLKFASNEKDDASSKAGDFFLWKLAGSHRNALPCKLCGCHNCFNHEGKDHGLCGT